MQWVIICLIGAAVLVSPCVYDTDPREPTPVAMIIGKAFSSNRSPELTTTHIHALAEPPVIVP